MIFLKTDSFSKSSPETCRNSFWTLKPYLAGTRKLLEDHMRNDLETHLFLACKVIKEQNGLIVGYRDRLKQEESERALIHQKLDNLAKDFESLRVRYDQDKDERVGEGKNVSDKLELQREYQAQVNDELRLQIHGIKSKIELGKAQGNDKTSPMNVSPLFVKKNDHERKRLNSEDSPGSSLNSLLHRSTHQRAELVWRINAFSRKLRKIQSGANEDPFISDPFTTGPYGYRVSVWVYLNGRGKGASNSVSIYVRVMCGEFDPVLVWPIKPTYTFMLLDQTADSSQRRHHIRVRDLSVKHGGIDRPKKEDKSVIVGFDDFIVHEDLEKNNYLIDDTVFIRVIVDIPEH
ncbi:TNF receptor-associated factor 5-like isoform X3 [Rhopilema esculentum]|uniref:TNF receptor-associated factor 5-like isoform X3 n=1 Tax=Rhopilema esculentum TaxID=499914 RepID=UPI0031E1A1ED